MTLPAGLRAAVLALSLACAAACTSLAERTQASLTANPAQVGIRWGVMVADLEGREILAIGADDRFTPASNTKIVTSAAAFQWRAALEAAGQTPGLRADLEFTPGNPIPDLVLLGGGDGGAGDGPACTKVCLSQLAEAIAARGITRIRDVIGDDTRFPHEPWGPGWSQEDLQYGYGTAVSALSVNDNALWLVVSPATELGAPAQLNWLPGDDLYPLINEVITVAAGSETRLRRERLPGSTFVRVFGQIAADSPALTRNMGIEVPAHAAALRLARLVGAHGITVTGRARARHRPLSLDDEPGAGERLGASVAAGLPRLAVAALPPQPLIDSLIAISKDSDNLQAELVLRRLGMLEGTGSRAHGLAMVEALMSEAGVDRRGYDLSDGSGMSIYNRLSPRAVVQLLIFINAQDWGRDWRDTQPTGGVDGSLRNRFRGTPLEGQIFAKTGTLNGVNALSGYLVAASGQTLAFSIFANDRPSATRSATTEMDAALLAIAQAN